MFIDSDCLETTTCQKRPSNKNLPQNSIIALNVKGAKLEYGFQWSGLMVFLKHPQVALDNNSGERKRP